MRFDVRLAGDGFFAVAFVVVASLMFFLLSPLFFVSGMYRWATEEIPEGERKTFVRFVALAGAFTLWWLCVAGAVAAAIVGRAR